MSKAPPSEGRFAHLPYRRCVGIMLLNRRDEIFVGRRIDTAVEAWQMPQGGIDGDEEPHRAALREMKEEIGTDRAEILAESADWLNYDLPEHLVPRVWRGRYRGQTMKWFALRFIGRDSDIDIATEHAEFMAWRWMRPEDLLTAIVPFKHAIYVSVFSEFADLLNPGAR